MSGQPPALHFLCLRESQAKDEHRRKSERAKLDKKICLSYLHLEAEVRDGGGVLSFPKKWHIHEEEATDEPAASIDQGRPVADASITMLQVLNFWT